MEKIILGHNLKQVTIYGDNNCIIIRKEDLTKLKCLPESELFKISEILIEDWEYEARSINIDIDNNVITYTDDNTYRELDINLI